MMDTETIEFRPEEKKTLNIGTGVVTYNLNGVYDLTFNPTDSTFVERLFDTFDELDKKQEQYKEEAELAKNSGDRRAIFKIARKRDAEMREMIDSALGAPVCDAVFGNMNVYSMSGGLPVWANLILAIMDEIDTSFSREQKLTDSRLKKYTDKYNKYRR